VFCNFSTSKLSCCRKCEQDTIVSGQKVINMFFSIPCLSLCLHKLLGTSVTLSGTRGPEISAHQNYQRTVYSFTPSFIHMTNICGAFISGTLRVKTLLSIQLSGFGVQREWGIPLNPNSLEAISGSDNLLRMQESCFLSHCITCWSPSHTGCLSITWALERQPPPQWSSCFHCSNLICFASVQPW